MLFPSLPTIGLWCFWTFSAPTCDSHCLTGSALEEGMKNDAENVLLVLHPFCSICHQQILSSGEFSKHVNTSVDWDCQSKPQQYFQPKNTILLFHHPRLNVSAGFQIPAIYFHLNVPISLKAQTRQWIPV
ncbi:MAG: hypothetical protein ACI4NO_01205 [Oxalobacter sp.]